MLEELEEFFNHLSDKQRTRIILKYVLKLPNSQISIIENISKQALSETLIKCREEFFKLQKHDDLIDKIQRLFANNLD